MSIMPSVIMPNVITPKKLCSNFQFKFLKNQMISFPLSPLSGNDISEFNPAHFVMLFHLGVMLFNRTARIKHQCRKMTVISCHRCLINIGVEKVNNISI